MVSIRNPCTWSSPWCCHKTWEANYYAHNINYLQGGQGGQGAESTGIRVDWLDRLIGGIHKEKEHTELVHKDNILREHVNEIKKQLHIAEHQLKIGGGEDGE